MLNEDEIDPKLCAQLLSRREEADGARVLAVQAVERVEVGRAELLVLAALVEDPRRAGQLARFPRVALAVQSGPFARVILVRPSLCGRVASALRAAPGIADELLDELPCSTA